MHDIVQIVGGLLIIGVILHCLGTVMAWWDKRMTKQVREKYFKGIHRP